MIQKRKTRHTVALTVGGPCGRILPARADPHRLGHLPRAGHKPRGILF